MAIAITLSQASGFAMRSDNSATFSWLNMESLSSFPSSDFADALVGIATPSFDKGGRQGRSGPNKARPCNAYQNQMKRPTIKDRKGTMGETPLPRFMERQ